MSSAAAPSTRMPVTSNAACQGRQYSVSHKMIVAQSACAANRASRAPTTRISNVDCIRLALLRSSWLASASSSRTRFAEWTASSPTSSPIDSRETEAGAQRPSLSRSIIALPSPQNPPDDQSGDPGDQEALAGVAPHLILQIRLDALRLGLSHVIRRTIQPVGRTMSDLGQFAIFDLLRRFLM